MRCIKSIADTADSHDNFEICLRIHRDDKATILMLPDLLSLCTIRVVIGLQHKGYESLSWFYQEAAAISRGDWVWVMNDDVVSKTKGWDTMVMAQQPDAVVMPDTYYLGGSGYPKDTHNPFMFLPNKCWERYGVTRFGTPFDQQLWDLMKNNGWPTRFIPIEVWHDHRAHEHVEERKDEKSEKFNGDPHEHYMENL